MSGIYEVRRFLCVNLHLHRLIQRKYSIGFPLIIYPACKYYTTFEFNIHNGYYTLKANLLKFSLQGQIGPQGPPGSHGERGPPGSVGVRGYQVYSIEYFRETLIYFAILFCIGSSRYSGKSRCSRKRWPKWIAR